MGRFRVNHSSVFIIAFGVINSCFLLPRKTTKLVWGTKFRGNLSMGFPYVCYPEKQTSWSQKPDYCRAVCSLIREIQKVAQYNILSLAASGFN